MAKKDKKDEEEAEDKKDEKEEAKSGDAGEGGEGGEEGEGGEGAPKSSKKKLIIIAVIALVVLIGGGVGAYFAFFSSHEETAEGEKEAKEAAKSAIYYTLPQFLVNLNAGKQTSFLKATIVLELESQLDVLPLEGALPKLLDSYNTYLRELRASDLAGSAGIQRLREELLLRANKSAGVKVNDVLFKEIIVQ